MIVAAAVALGSAEASAQCEAEPGAIDETFPASGSRDVPVNGMIMVLYCDVEAPTVDRRAARVLEDLGGAGPGCACGRGECVQLGALDHCLLEVPASVHIPVDATGEEGNEVWIYTETDLAQETTYVIEAPEPAGNWYSSFVTGTAYDTRAPYFDGIRSLTIVGCGPGFPSNAACLTQLEEGFTAILRADAASDEAGAVNIEYRVYQVREGERIERKRARGDGVSDVTISAFVPASQLTTREWERLCFAMSASDHYGHETLPEDSVCGYTPEFSPFSSMCSTAAVRPSGGHAAVWVLLAAFLFAVSVFSRRNRRR